MNACYQAPQRTIEDVMYIWWLIGPHFPWLESKCLHGNTCKKPLWPGVFCMPHKVTITFTLFEYVWYCSNTDGTRVIELIFEQSSWDHLLRQFMTHQNNKVRSFKADVWSTHYIIPATSEVPSCLARGEYWQVCLRLWLLCSNICVFIYLDFFINYIIGYMLNNLIINY